MEFDSWAELKQFFAGSGLKVLTVAVIAFFGILIIRNVIKLFKIGLIASRLDNALVNFVLAFIKFILYLLLALYCLNFLGIPLTGLVSALTALTLAVGLAVQDIISGVANGLMLVSTHPFKVNDFVDIDGVSGTVQELTLLHTVLNTPDNKHILIPNNKVFAAAITNYSTNELRRMDLNISVDYDSDCELARKVLEGVVNGHKLILSEPKPIIRWNTQHDSYIEFLVRVWVRNADYWNVKWDLDEQTALALKKAGINIPFPQVTLSYRTDAGSAVESASEKSEIKVGSVVESAEKEAGK